MKTVVSIPDDLFHLAEAAARALRISRSELYAKAIAECVQGQQVSLTEFGVALTLLELPVGGDCGRCCWSKHTDVPRFS